MPIPRSKLLETYAHVTQTLRASEEWEPSYSAAPEHLKRLIREEAKLQRSVNEYLLDLRDRVPGFLNWDEVKLAPIQAAAVPPLDDQVFKAEQALFNAAVAGYLLEMTAIGAQAGEFVYAIPLGIGPLDQAVLSSAATQTAKLVKSVTDTTRKYIQTAVQQSIAQGEDSFALINRIQQLVASPVRAEMIAQTESVTAYQSGLDVFGVQSGAKSSTWDALSGACQLCAPLDGKTAKLGESFVLGNGTAVLYPPGHPRCRCGRILNY